MPAEHTDEQGFSKTTVEPGENDILPLEVTMAICPVLTAKLNAEDIKDGIVVGCYREQCGFWGEGQGDMCGVPAIADNLVRVSELLTSMIRQRAGQDPWGD